MMPGNNQAFEREPAEGGREVVENELKKSERESDAAKGGANKGKEKRD